MFMNNTGELAILFRQYRYVTAAYLFGSASSGRAGPMSDLDIAILLSDDAPRGKELIHDEDYLAYQLEKLLGAGEVDLIDLNRQSLTFRHTVLRTGSLIYDADPPARVRFEAQVISAFCDFEPTLRFIEENSRRGRLKRGARL